MSKRRILYLSNLYPQTVNGVTSVVRQLLHNISASFQVGVICPNSSTKYRKELVDGVTHYFLPSYRNPIRADVRLITPNPLQIQKVFDDFSPQVVHIHDPSPASIVLKEISLVHNIPVIFSHHFTPQLILGYLPEIIKTPALNNSNLNQKILQIICKIYDHSSLIIVPTQTVKNSLATLTKIPIQVISNPIDINSLSIPRSGQIKRISSKYHLPSSPFVLYIGRMDPDKNIPILIKSWSILVSQFRSTLVLVGTGSKIAKLKKLAKDLEVSQHIIWTGLIEEAKLSFIYTNPHATVFVIPSPMESQSIVTLMAAAAGLPIVAANAGALPEIVKDGHNGYLCDPNDPSGFASKMLLLLKNLKKSHTMGHKGRKIVKDFDLKFIIIKYKSLYETILLDNHSHS